MLLPRKLADSRMMVFVVSRISELRPPMTPAMPMDFSPSWIISMELSRVRWVPSRVVKTSPS